MKYCRLTVADLKLSVVIPSYRDRLLQKTIDSLLQQSGLGEALEVIAVLDGYWPTVSLQDDDRLRIVHLGQNRGMRAAINAGVRASRGEYIMRTDEHAVFGDRYDLILTSQIRDNWIVTPRRYFLDPTKWAVMDLPRLPGVVQEGEPRTTLDDGGLPPWRP